MSEDVDIRYYSDKTHGMVGADLMALSREAAMRTLRRFLPDIDLEADTIPAEILDAMEVTDDDFKESAKEIQPSAMREVFVEIPMVTYADIGGLDERFHLFSEEAKLKNLHI